MSSSTLGRCVLALAALLLGCRRPGPASSAGAPPAIGPVASVVAPIDPWQACVVDDDCAVVELDRGACDLCLNTYAVARTRADEARGTFALTEAVEVCTDRDHSCAAATAACVAGACALQVPADPPRAARTVVRPLPAR